MYARVTQLEIDTLRISVDAALNVYVTEVLPELRAQPGYRGVYLLSTPEGKGLVLSLWETAEDARADAETGFYADVLSRFVTVFRSPPGRERYEVRLAELPVIVDS